MTTVALRAKRELANYGNAQFSCMAASANMTRMYRIAPQAETPGEKGRACLPCHISREDHTDYRALKYVMRRTWA